MTVARPAIVSRSCSEALSTADVATKTATHPRTATDALSLGGLRLVDSWAAANQNDIHSYEFGGTTDVFLNRTNGQVFTSQGGNLGSAKFSLLRVGTPTGSVVASLYAAIGSYPNAKGVDPPLATSDPVDPATISTVGGDLIPALYQFFFTGANQYAMTNGTKYVIVAEFVGGSQRFLCLFGYWCRFRF